MHKTGALTAGTIFSSKWFGTPTSVRLSFTTTGSAILTRRIKALVTNCNKETKATCLHFYNNILPIVILI